MREKKKIGITKIFEAIYVVMIVIVTITTIASAETPTIEFTYVPQYGSNEYLQGKITNVIPTDYKVAIYIYVSGWWTKPFYADPLTSINNDGSWSCNIVTGGDDQNATKIRAYLVPNGYDAPLMAGDQTFPVELDSKAVASVENIRVSDRHINFSGLDWIVKLSTMRVGPGNNYFSNSNQSVWIDNDGQLHLKILNIDGKWYSAEVYTTKIFGYGKYIYHTASKVDQLDKNIVAGLFIWDDTTVQYYNREIDIEFSRWGEETGYNSQYVVQPWQRTGNRIRFDLLLNGNDSAHSFDWEGNNVTFQSIEENATIQFLTYDGSDTVHCIISTGS